MSDTSPSPNVPSTNLIQRLDRRRTQSLGVINTRRFQAQAAPMPEWMVQRSALLDQLHTRYSSQDHSAMSGSELIVTNGVPQPLGDLSKFSSMVDHSLVSSVQSTIPMNTSAEGTDTPQFRVRRKAVPLDAKSDGSPAPKMALHLSSLTRPEAANHDLANPDQPTVNQSSANSGDPNQASDSNAVGPEPQIPIVQGRADGPLIMRNAKTSDVDLVSDSGTNIGEDVDPPSVDLGRSPDLPLAKLAQSDPIGPSRPHPQTSFRANGGTVDRASTPTSTSGSMSSGSMASGSMASGSIVQRSSRTQATGTQAIGTQATVALPLAQAQSTGLLMQRQSENGLTHMPFSSPDSSRQSVRDGAIATSSPIRTSSRLQATIVWRKPLPFPNTPASPSGTSPSDTSPSGNRTTSTALPLTISSMPQSGNVIARQPTPASVPSAVESNAVSQGHTFLPEATPITEPTLSVPTINVALIADQVSRILFRKIAVERERRGICQ